MKLCLFIIIEIEAIPGFSKYDRNKAKAHSTHTYTIHKVYLNKI